MCDERRILCRCQRPSFDQRLSLWSPPIDRSMGLPHTTSVLGWFDNQMNRLQEDLHSLRFFGIPQVARVAFDPERRSRLFDALFDEDTSSNLRPQFSLNTAENRVECQLSTGCGDFFRPEDIEVNIKGRDVEFKARREENSDDRNSYSVREVRRLFTVPETADIEGLQAEIGPNGKVVLTAPLIKPAIENKPQQGPIPIKINRA
ncbi:uncharacterized protein LOC100903582 [Galendromus occidentalis]|uniref:Uncharacterized protein LOC100903582 n=1 Tax=Galendromus occidentalis TaxID=34638 RepID=A0AAJ6QME3_9ACAR|nr:uncharacterized protein LOC100903582 [Galendromus occidentalis]